MASRNLVGIDVGSKFVKAVQITETSGQYKVTEFGIAKPEEVCTGEYAAGCQCGAKSDRSGGKPGAIERIRFDGRRQQPVDLSLDPHHSPA